MRGTMGVLDPRRAEEDKKKKEKSLEDEMRRFSDVWQTLSDFVQKRSRPLQAIPH